MQRTITLRSSSQLTDLLYLLLAAFLKIIMNLVEVVLLLGACFMRKVRNDDISFAEMAFLMGIGIFISHVLSLLGFVF